jgi:hypothetical protein
LLLAQGSFLPLNNKRALDYSLARALWVGKNGIWMRILNDSTLHRCVSSNNLCWTTLGVRVLDCSRMHLAAHRVILWKTGLIWYSIIRLLAVPFLIVQSPQFFKLGLSLTQGDRSVKKALVRLEEKFVCLLSETLLLVIAQFKFISTFTLHGRLSWLWDLPKISLCWFQRNCRRILYEFPNHFERICWTFSIMIELAYFE